jgi:translation initiation factor 2B subunit (eIF-2B alpha/beta/delta family)
VTTADKIVQNTLLTAVARVAIVAASAALVPFGGWVVAQANAINIVEGRVTVIETRMDLDQAAQRKFQDETQAALRELQASNTRILQSLATLIERTETSRRGTSE